MARPHRLRHIVTLPGGVLANDVAAEEAAGARMARRSLNRGTQVVATPERRPAAHLAARHLEGTP